MRGRRAEVGGRRSEGRGRRSKVGGIEISDFRMGISDFGLQIAERRLDDVAPVSRSTGFLVSQFPGLLPKE